MKPLHACSVRTLTPRFTDLVIASVPAICVKDSHSGCVREGDMRGFGKSMPLGPNMGPATYKSGDTRS